MGWLDSIWPSSSGADDPLRKLDPKLREFLEKESPVKYQSGSGSGGGGAAAAPTNKADDDDDRTAARLTPTTAAATTPPSAATPTTTTTDAEAKQHPGVPPESQFPDGRYAHLWRTYRPQAEVEAAAQSDHERLMDVLEAFKERRAAIGRAALENCALEQADWRACMAAPSMGERFTMCRDQVRRFERCYMTQTRLLKALGYLSTYNRTPAQEEEIQMHADALYQRLQAQEAAIAAAKAAGEPAPSFAPVIPSPSSSSSSSASTTTTTSSALPTTQEPEEEEELSPDQLATLRAKLDKVDEPDRPAEEQALRAELRAKAEVAGRVQRIWEQQDAEREARRQRGEATLWDRVAGAFASGRGGGEGEKK
ncbi:hypothetical protein F4780DRAFT_773425 [Xylariomycetidae sp. FL0641]|nr:hypothetical protein F4780DRAFT_773425 [Xylariomycetidae sp. FL0641]